MTTTCSLGLNGRNTRWLQLNSSPDSIIILTLKLKSIIAPVTRKTTIAYHDNGVARFEEPKLGVTYHVEWVISRESTGKNKGLATRLQAKSLS